MSDTTDALPAYLSQINRYPLLGVEEERALARQYRDCADSRAAHQLVTANLRFVVKVAYEYRSYGLRMSDLIQEGNLGLMKAVQKFDPEKGIRLISYAVWWIRAYIQNHLLANWSLVKLGTTQAQRKLFFSLGRARREIERQSGQEIADPKLIAKRLRVRTSEVVEMQRRMEGRDLSLHAPLNGEPNGTSHLDLVPSSHQGHDEELEDLQHASVVAREVREALDCLDARERFIIENRMLVETPLTYSQIGRELGFSRERARQLELRAPDKLRREITRRGVVEPERSSEAL